MTPRLAGSRSWDVIVVGAGPAGSMLAYELGRERLAVLLVERDPFPRWKLCGACLSASGRATLQRAGLGSLAGRLGAVPLREFQLRGWSRRLRLPLAGPVCLSRQALDAALVAAATGVGVELLTRAHAVPGLCRAGGRRVSLRHPDGDVELEAKVVVAADGLGGSFMSRAETEDRGIASRLPSRVGVGAIYDRDAGPYREGVVYMAVGAEGYAGVVRLEDGRVNIAAAVDPCETRRDGGAAAVVARILEDNGIPPPPGDAIEGWRGTPGLTWAPPRRALERLFAVGDAAGYVEPFTGEGIGWALDGALALAPIVRDAAIRWDPSATSRWDAVYRQRIRRAQRLCRVLAWCLQRPRVARATMLSLAALPALARPFVRKATAPRAGAEQLVR